MSTPAIVTEAQGGVTIPLKVPLKRGGSVNLEAFLEPMGQGFEKFAESLEEGSIIKLLVTPETAVNWAVAMATKDDVPALLETWATAAGFTEAGLSVLSYAIYHLDLVEVDFQRFYGLDLRDWFNPGSTALTSRRVVTLILGLKDLTESLFWASLSDYSPMSKTEILLAHIASSLGGELHPLLQTKSDRAQKEKDAQQREEALARIAAREKLNTR